MPPIFRLLAEVSEIGCIHLMALRLLTEEEDKKKISDFMHSQLQGTVKNNLVLSYLLYN